ncbi:MAG: MucBP domain-containing protein [Roseburia sp.]
MKHWKILQKCLLIGSVFLLMTGQTAFAQVGGNEECYTYTVTLYAGNQGQFSGADGVQVDNHTTGSSYQIIEGQKNGEKISITGLQYGDMVMVNAPTTVEMEETSRYYVKGIRESGRDNNTAGASAFKVEADREYVVAYGIKGDMVSYVVNYQDTEGNALAESQTFYGTVGDQPVVAFRYIENYQPQAYNLTKTLSDNEAENVFTFVYQSTGTITGGANAGDNGGVGANGANAGNAGGANAGDNGGAGNAGGADAGNADGANAGNADGDNAGNADGDNAENNENQETPQEIVNLDDEETPLAAGEEESAQKRPMKNMLLFLGIGVAALAALGILAAVIIRKKKKISKVENKSEAEEKEKDKGSDL